MLCPIPWMCVQCLVASMFCPVNIVSICSQSLPWTGVPIPPSSVAETPFYIVAGSCRHLIISKLLFPSVTPRVFRSIPRCCAYLRPSMLVNNRGPINWNYLSWSDHHWTNSQWLYKSTRRIIWPTKMQLALFHSNPQQQNSRWIPSPISIAADINS